MAAGLTTLLDLPSPGIVALLPYGEYFGPEFAGAIALKVRDEALASRYVECLRVCGRPIRLPFTDVRYRPLKPVLKRLLGRNRGLAVRLRRELKGRSDALVEVHNRPHLVPVLASPFRPLVLHVHNDPQTMRGLRTAKERQRLLEQVEAVICVSAWVRTRFLEGLQGGADQVHVVRNGVPLCEVLPEKERRILFVGRMIEEKGVLELVEALVRVLPQHPGWRATLIAPTRFGTAGKSTPYRERVLRAAKAAGDVIQHIEFLPNQLVFEQLARASVLVVPSIWPEPLSRTAIEGFAHGCAVIASDRGGLPEVVSGRGLLLPVPTPDAIADALDRVLENDELRHDLQALGRQHFPFTPEASSAVLDAVRAPILERLSHPAS